jgi:hypothetical protein
MDEKLRDVAFGLALIIAAVLAMTIALRLGDF